MQIFGPNGTFMGVTGDQRAMVQSISPDDVVAEVLNGWAFTLIEDTVTPTSTDDCFLYVGNNSSDYLVVTRIQMETAGAEDIYAKMSATYTLATTHAAVDSAYNRSGASNAFSTKGTAEAGVDITGISTSYEIARWETGAGTMYPNLLNGSAERIVIGPGQALSIFAGTGTTANTHIAVDCHFVMQSRINA